jgi:glycine/D-amino acid oxidase-like deaminating enzyme
VITIVGGGLIGLSCAWELQRRGVAVRVLDRGGEARRQASWAGAGMLISLGTEFQSGIWAERARASAAMYPEWIESLGGGIDFTPNQQVDPRGLLAALRERITVEVAEVAAIADLGTVVLATGAWPGLALGAEEALPVKGYLLAWDGFAAGTLPSVLKQNGTYVFQRNGGRVIAGSTEERVGFDDAYREDLVADLARRAGLLWPRLAGVAPDEVWWGFRPGTADGLPIVRRWNERVLLAYGHFRNGILLAPWTARWVADELTSSSKTSS